MERGIINASMLFFFAMLVFGLFTTPQFTGMVTSDEGYKSPTTGPGYLAPKVGPGYEETTIGPGYQESTVGPGYQKPETGPGYIAPESDNWTAPTTGPGFQSPGTNDSGNTTLLPVEPIINQTGSINQTAAVNQTILLNQTDQNQTVLPNQTSNIIPRNDTDNKEDFLPQWKFVGKWRVITVLVSYADGEWEYVDPPTDLLDIKNEHEWEMGTQKGTWRVEKIEEADWERWQIKKYSPETKLVFDEPDGSITDGPMEPNQLWIIYDVDQNDGKGVRNVQIRLNPAVAQTDYLFTVDKIGAGLVRSLDKKIDCGSVCLKNYKVDQLVTLVATPDEGWVFSKWSGDCIGTENVCRVVVQGKMAVAAEFKGSCKDNEGCPQDQACINSNCVQLECKCGVVKNHACQKYECCYDSDCGDGKKCNVQARKCIAASSCKEVLKNGDPAKKHDMVFVGANFKDYETFEKMIKLLLDYEGKFETKLGVFSLTPFKENKDKFNFWMVLVPDYPHYTFDSPVKGVGADTLYIPDETYYETFVQSCERDTVVVVSPYLFRSFAKFPTSGASGGIVYLSLENPLKGSEYLGRTLAHELGHAFGGLADEYVEYGSADLTETGEYPNCAPNLEAAQAKWGDLEGIRGVHYYTGIEGIEGTTYYKNPEQTFPELGLFPDGSDWGDGGCAYVHKNIRPTQTSIMKSNYDLENDFGPVNERILSEKLSIYDSQDQEPIEPQGTRGRRFIEDQG